MAKQKQVVTVEQSMNPKWSQGMSERYVYLVVSLKNRLEPAINTWIMESQINSLIDDGVEVNVRAMQGK